MNYVVSADVMLSLMMLQQDGDFVPSEPRTYEYFFLVSDTFTADLVESSKNLMNRIYHEHYEIFKIREPDDPNYIAVVDVSPRILLPDELSQQPWLAAEIPVWENSNCLIVQNDSYQKIATDNFDGYLGLAG